jgi:dipeptidyl aminopeptidase/acylaminoacyl peptidase
VFTFAHYLNIRSAIGPSFRYDNKCLYYLTDTTGTYQVWSAELDGSWPQQRTFFPDRVQAVHASPRGDRVLCGVDHGGNEHQQFYVLEDDGTHIRALTDDPETIFHFGGWDPTGSRVSFGANERHRAYFDVGILDVLTGERRYVFADNSNTYPGTWSPDGASLVFSKVESSAQNTLYVFDSATQQVRELTPHDGDARYEDAVWHADGARLVMLSDEKSDFLGLCELDLESGMLHRILTPGHDVDGLALSPDGHYLAYAINVDGYGELTLRNVRTGAEQKPEGIPPGAISELCWSPNSSLLAFSCSGPSDPAEIYVWDITSSIPRRVTFSGRGGIPEATFVTPRTVAYPTFDGRRIPGYLYVPMQAEVGQPIPTVVHVHGGPESQAKPSFNAVFQFLADRGFAVFVPNVRGSTGYGKSYSHLDDVERRMDSVHDLEMAVRWLVAEGIADQRRIAIMGGSYGGFMTLAAITTYAELWAAAVDIVGIANFETFFAHTSVWRRDHRAREYGDPVKDRDLLRELSPIHRTANIRAPLFVIHGKNDPRVPVIEAEQIVASIRERRGIVDYMLFDDEGHGIAKLQNRIKAYDAIASFLARHLLGS